MVAQRNRTTQRDHLTMLIQKVTDDELEDAIALLEWLTDPELRYLVDQLAG